MTNVSIISEPGQQWDLVFEEIATAFADALAGTQMQLVFGAHLLAKDDPSLDEKVIYQSEQVAVFPGQLHPAYLDILKNHETWDYSKANVEELKKYDIEAKWVPVRYMPSMTRFKSLPPEQQDIDVLFYGTTNKRRIGILNDLIRAGLRVHKLYNCFGAERDAWIARSKIVLNIHNHEHGIFEIFRCANLFANSKCVVSEMGMDTALEVMYDECCKIVHPDNLVHTCVRLVEDQGARSVQEFRALDSFKRVLLKDEVRKVIPCQYPLYFSRPLER